MVIDGWYAVRLDRLLMQAYHLQQLNDVEAQRSELEGVKKEIEAKGRMVVAIRAYMLRAFSSRQSTEL